MKALVWHGIHDLRVEERRESEACGPREKPSSRKPEQKREA